MTWPPPQQPNQPYGQQPYAQPGYPQQPYGQGFGFPPPPPPAYRPSVSALSKAIGWATAGGGLLVLLGAVLPWVTIDSIYANASKNGLDGDGRLTLVFGLIALGLGITRGLGQIGVIASAVSLSAGLITMLVAIIDVSDVVSTSNALGFSSLSVGVGLWLTLVAGVLVAAVSVVGLIRRR